MTTTTTTSGAADLLAMVSKALREAYYLGQRYWQQTDSEYISQHKKADDTRANFLALVEETCAALAAGQATAAQAVVPAGWKLVPVDATDEMVRATDEVNFENGDTDGTMHNVWHVMIAAAPALPAAQQGVAYAALPDLSDADGEIWRAIIYWGHAKRGEDALRKASELERVLSDQMRAFADATHTLRASHGQALRLLTQKEKDSLGRRAEGMDGNEWDQWVQEKFAQVNGLKVQGGSYERDWE